MKLGVSVSLTVTPAFLAGSEPPSPDGPVFTQQPALSGAFEVGQPVSLTLGMVTPALVDYTIARFELDGVDKRAELAGLSWDTSGEDVSGGGQIAYQVEAANSAGAVLSDVILATLAPPPPPPDWLLENLTDHSFDIASSLEGGHSPLASDAGGGLMLLGEVHGWMLDNATHQNFRVVQSVSNGSAPDLTGSGTDHIQIGV